jgi:enamine deaminase RidA (YjgF/YER057c/UK114 family)
MSEEGPTIRKLNPATMPSPYGYSQVVDVTARRTVYLAGQVPLDERNELVGAGDFPAQVRQTFENVRRGLEAVGLTFDDVVKMHMYLTDIANLPALRDVRDEFVNTDSPPASTTMQVAALFRPEVMFELDVTAVG